MLYKTKFIEAVKKFEGFWHATEEIIEAVREKTKNYWEKVESHGWLEAG